MKPLNFTLRQHTPMLHFQASQEGATLRASDVKPRFDRWLIKKVWNDNFDECCSYLVGYSDKFSEKQREDFKKKFEGGFRALNYKMRIVVLSEDTPRSTHRENQKGKMVSDCPMYFGAQMETISRDCRVEFIFTGYPIELKKAIEDNFTEFINSHNFGTRSSKGYGSFTVDGKIEIHNKLFYTTSGTYLDVLNEVDILYKTMRSGINFGGVYFKSLMFSYAKSMGLRWDKKTIKEAMLIDKERKRQTKIWKAPDVLSHNDRSEDKFDFRDALGLSTSESWMFYGVNLSKNRSDDNKSLIKRFASPIMFKPVFCQKTKRWLVYIFWNELPDKIYEKEIVVSVYASKRMADKVHDKILDATSKNPMDLVTLRIHPEFRVADYINYIFKHDNGKYKVSIDKQFAPGCRNKLVQEKIKRIYEELRENYNK